jgi:uncharacterized protein YecE (DUF72 family)
VDQIYCGLSGLQLPIPKYKFPPPFEQSSRLTYYSSIFNSIEVNSSFYKIPKLATVAKWADTVPEGFAFTFKLWKGITHVRGLMYNKEDIFSFFESINAVGEKKGSLLIQLPPGITANSLSQLHQLLSYIKEADATESWKLAVEFRHSSWYNENTYSLLKIYCSAVVIQDIPKSSTPDLDHTLDFMYIRFHGPAGNYRDGYTGEFLDEYADYIHEWISEGKTVFVYFNNTMGDAFDNAITLNKKIRESCRKDLL